MRQILLLIFILTCSGFVFSQTTENEKDKIEISVCQPALTEAGRQSTFHFNYSYRLSTNSIGAVAGVKTILPTEKDKKTFAYLMNDQNVIPCIKKWTLKPSTSYRVILSVGTTGGPNYLSISSSGQEIKIYL